MITENQSDIPIFLSNDELKLIRQCVKTDPQLIDEPLKLPLLPRSYECRKSKSSWLIHTERKLLERHATDWFLWYFPFNVKKTTTKQ